MIKKILGVCMGLGLLTSSLLVFADTPEEQAATQAAIDEQNAAEFAATDQGKCENRPSSYGKTDGRPYYQWTEATKKCTCIPSPNNCCGIALYTNVPFVGKCIEYGGSEVVNNDGSVTVVSPVNAFPVLLGAMSKILLSVILIVCFGAIVVAGVMISSGNNEKGKSLITHVVIAMALLGASGVILRLINPTFFQ